MARGRRSGRVRPGEPQRRCLVCRSRRPQPELLRVAVQDGRAVADRARRLPGRGAWLCRGAGCLGALKRGQLSRALKRPVTEPTAAEIQQWASP